MKMIALKKIDLVYTKHYTDEEFEVEDERHAKILVARKLATYKTRELRAEQTFDRELKPSPKKRGRKPKNRAE